MFRRAFLVAPAAVLALAMGGCGDDEMGPTGPGTLVIRFDHAVDGQTLVMNIEQYTNAAGNTYGVTRLEYVISDFHLHPADSNDEEFESDAPHYRTEADNPGTREVTFADVPSGTYNELAFTFGIDGADNVTGAFPELDAAAMGWPMMMGGGYHYMRFEGTYNNGADAFTTHTGPSGGMDFSIDFELDTDVVISPGQTTTVTVQMNLNEWYRTPNVYDFDDYGAIMGDQAAQQILRDNGADVFSIASVTTE